MKILVTGGCGFIGAGFVRQICKNYPSAMVACIDCLNPCSSVASDLTTNHDNYKFIRGDIKDTLLVRNTLESFKPDTIVHFAAQSHVDTSFTDPISYTNDNVLGTHVLLEACRQVGCVKKFVHISTDEVYGENGEGDGVKTEESLLKPTNPYAATKAAAEMLVHSYMHSYQFPAVIIRSNNVYGPGQFPEKVIPKFIQQLLRKEKLTIQGSGQQLRSCLYLDDAVAAIECVMFQGHVGSVYNISSDHELSIMELAHKLITKIHGTAADPATWITHIDDRNFNDSRYWIRSEPLARLGWRQKVGFEEGLDRTIQWFREADNSYWSHNQPKKVLVWGGRGWIGGLFETELARQGWEVAHAESRADNREAVFAEISAQNPSHLLSLIGRTHGPGFGTIDYLEQPGKLRENIRDNLYGPMVLAEASRETGKHLLYMGTGCIFSGSPEEKFTESASPNFFGSAYSTVKGFTDQLMVAFAANVLNVRIRMPIHSQDNPRNFITKIIQYQKINSIPNSMTVLDDIIPLLVRAMELRITGTLNAVNPGVMEHSEILRMYRDLQNVEHTWEELDTRELMEGRHVVAARSNNHLDTTRIQELFPELPSLRDSIERILRQNHFTGRRRFTGGR
jgi:UDP-glucose 4,6-dehydratase